MELIIYDGFIKKSNSTKQPTGGTVHNVKLKNGTSVQNPTFLIQGVDLNSNYCKWNNRFYFINDIVLGNNNIYELNCSTDYLATYKSNIAAASAFVERSASNNNVMFNDPYVSSSTDIVSINHKATPIPNHSAEGCFVLRTVGREPNTESTTGIISYAVASGDVVSDVIGYLFNKDNFAQEIEEEVTKTFFNPFQYIVDLKWYPLYAEAMTSVEQASTIKCGWWDSGEPGFILDKDYAKYDILISAITPHYNDFRQSNNSFTKYNLFLPGVGNVSIPGDFVREDLYISMNIDFINGSVVYMLTNSDDKNILASYSGQYGVDIQIGQVSSRLSGALSSAVNMGSALLTGNVVGAAISGVQTYQNLASPNNSINGLQGSRAVASNYGNIYLTEYAYGTGEILNTVAGRPCCKNLLLGTLSGYVKCSNASLDIAGLSGDKEAVNNLLNSGFYME